MVIIYEELCVRMLLNVLAADQAAEISYGFSLDLRLDKLVPVNYCFYENMYKDVVSSVHYQPKRFMLSQIHLVYTY